MSDNRITKVSNDTKLVKALAKYFKGKTSLSLLGVDYGIPALQKLFNEHIAVSEQAEQAHTALNAAVAAQNTSEANIRPIRRALSKTVAARFGDSAPELVEFGFKPRKETKKTAATKAEAAEKANATKAAGGKKAQKKAAAKVKTEAETAAEPPPATTVPATTATQTTTSTAGGKVPTGG